MRRHWALAGILLNLLSFSSGAQQLIYQDATSKTKNLYQNLFRLADDHIMFGHQDDMAYGVGWVREVGRSDVKDVAGSYPAVMGWDLGHWVDGKSLDGVLQSDIREWMIQTYKSGGINTVSLHWDNFTTGGNSWDTTPTVKYILPGGKDHARYVHQLDELADFINTVKAGRTLVPLIFRPLHEHNGSWFWWGREHCTEQEFIQLWQFTVDYLRNEKGLHQLIYAYSPDASRMNTDSLEASYLYGYPGDAYVDMLGIDDYWYVGRDINPRSPAEQGLVFAEILKTVTRLAAEHHKVPALTETGQESITNPRWFSEHITGPIGQDDSIKLSYILVWRNANSKHHYAPYPGHPVVADFKEFVASDRILMLSDLRKKHLYRK